MVTRPMPSMMVRMLAARATAEPSSSDSTSVTSDRTRPAAIARPSQPRAYMKKARKLRTQATTLKNTALTGETPCHCTSAGACHISMASRL